MKMLTIDTATSVCGVALTEEDKLIAEYRLNRKNLHNEKLVSAIEFLVEDAHWQLSQLDGIALSIGPGSFTGLRIGVSVCKGLAYSLGTALVAVNTLDALAFAAPLWQGQICAIINARENEVYCALYEKNLEYFKRISEYQIVRLEDVFEQIKERTLLISNPYELVADTKNSKIIRAPHELSMTSLFSVAKLGLQKLQNREYENPESSEPFYLKEFKPKRKVYYAEK